jgi:hypothetical protein
MNEESKTEVVRSDSDTTTAALSVVESEPRPLATELPLAEVRSKMASGVAAGNVSTAVDSTPGTAEPTGPLFSTDESKNFRTRWDAVQVGFVDEPRQAVKQADGLVAVAMKRLAEIFAEERTRLDGQWDRGDDVSTEDLRLALQRYRSFFGRLLSV